MSLSELSSCLPATPIFSYRVTATLSIRSDAVEMALTLNDFRTSLIKNAVDILYRNDISTQKKYCQSIQKNVNGFMASAINVYMFYTLIKFSYIFIYFISPEHKKYIIFLQEIFAT